MRSSFSPIAFFQFYPYGVTGHGYSQQAI